MFPEGAEPRFLLWLARALQLPVTAAAAGVYALEVPAGVSEQLRQTSPVRCVVDPKADSSEEGSLLTADSAVGGWLLNESRDQSEIFHACPAQQPTRIHEISQRLFAAYHIAGGNMHLGGCTLEDRPLLRLTWRAMGTDSDRQQHLVHGLMTADGELLDAGLGAELGLDDLELLSEPPRVARHDFEAWRQAALRQMAPSPAELVAATVVWCKYVEGKVAFEIGECRSDVTFAGWAKPLADGLVAPPPFICAETGRSSYRVAATDDGRISVEEAVGACQHSARRVLVTELEMCSATGKQVWNQLLAECPVTGERLLREMLMTCEMCGQDAHPAALKDGRCHVCRQLRVTSKDDPRMARILGEHPQIDGSGRWRLGETGQVYVVMLSTLLRRWLWVFDKETLEIRRLAEGSRFTRSWSEAPPADRRDFV